MLSSSNNSKLELSIFHNNTAFHSFQDGNALAIGASNE